MTDEKPIKVNPGAETYVALSELRAAPSDPDRDARREAYRADQRRKAARALDRYLEARFAVLVGSEATDVAGNRFVEAVGDYVLSRLHHNSHYVAPVDAKVDQVLAWLRRRGVGLTPTPGTVRRGVELDHAEALNQRGAS